MKFVKKLSRYKFIQIFLLLYTGFGFFSLPQFGVPLDELTQRFIGIENNRFIMGDTDADTVLKNKFYGPVFESISYGLEQVIYNQPLRVKLYLRHILLFLIFILALNCFYKIAKYFLKQRGAPELTTFMLALYPPLFAHSFYNSKDTFFLELIIFSLYFFTQYLRHQKLKWVIYMAMVIGIASTVRFLGLFMLVSIGFALLFWREKELKTKAQVFVLSSIVSILAFYLFFPLFWKYPLEGFDVLWQYITKNPWPWDELVTGVWVKSGIHPWWYLPIWLSVSIPLASIVLFILGCIQAFRQGKYYQNPLLLCIFSLFFMPFIYTIVSKPTLYDGWRHLQFLCVPLFLIIGLGVDYVLKKMRPKGVILALGTYSLVVFCAIHPFQYAYFNEIYLTLWPRNSFTQDYWGLSSKNCMEWIHKNDSSANILISSSTIAPELNTIWNSASDRTKFRFTQQTGTGKYEIQIKRDHLFPNLKGKSVFVVCPLKDTIARVVVLDKD